jgi:hypothetical protein
MKLVRAEKPGLDGRQKGSLYPASILVVASLLQSCDEYESCEATRSCPSVQSDSGPGGASGSGPGGSAGSAGSASAGTFGFAGAAGTAGIDGTVGSGGSAGTAGTDGADAGGDASDAPPPDTTAPTIVSVSPADGSSGVRKDVSISITFSEPMNRERTQAAYSSADLAPSAVTFAWSADDTVLTIDPVSDLVYVADTVPLRASPKKYSFTLTSAATDRAGNGLASEFAGSFTTSRQVTQMLAAQVWKLEELGAERGVFDCTQGSLFIGETATGGPTAYQVALFQFDLSALAPGVQSFVEATLRAQQGESLGTPFGASHLGDVVVDHTSFDPIDGTAISGAALRRLGVFSSSPTPGPRSLRVLVAATEDHQKRIERSYRSQYRLAFSRRSGTNPTTDLANFSCESGSRPELALEYLVP